MRKFLLLLALSLSLPGFAQDTTETSTDEKKSDVKFDLYIGIGGIVQGDYNLNEKLSNASLPEIGLTVPEFTVGWNAMAEQYAVGFEFGFFGAENKSANERSRIMGFNSRVIAHYNLINKEKIAFTGGLNIGYTSNQVDVYSKNTVVDLNNLGDQANALILRNGMFFAGPSVGVYLFKNKKYATRVNLAYELALTRGRWKSDYSAVNNAVGESGNNRFVFGITLL
jgi:hypothetical protein